MAKKVLIIGGDSFIGNHFISQYGNKYDFKVVSRKSTSCSKEIVIEDFFNIPEEIFNEIDVVINYAAIVHCPNCKDQNLYKKVNYELALIMAEIAFRKGVKHFIQFSSIAVYGESEHISSSTAHSPNDLYGEYKLKADQSLIANYGSSKMIVSCIRPSMIYGGGLAPGNMLKLIRLVDKKLPLPFGGIKNKRQFLNINNLEASLEFVINNQLGGEIIIADPFTVSTTETIKQISVELGHKPKIFKVPGFWFFLSLIKKSLVKKLIGDLIIENSFSYSEMGIENYHSLRDGISEMIKAYKS